MESRGRLAFGQHPPWKMDNRLLTAISSSAFVPVARMGSAPKKYRCDCSCGSESWRFGFPHPL